MVFRYLPLSYRRGRHGAAREKVHYASTVAGMALTIAGLGIEPVLFKHKIPEMAERAFADRTATTNPRFPLVNELADLYRLAYGLPLSPEVGEGLLDFSLLQGHDLPLLLYRTRLWEGEERPQSAPQTAH